MIIDHPSASDHSHSSPRPRRGNAATLSSGAPRALGLLRAGDSILFIGDSITDAFRRPDERNNAFRLGGGYVLLVCSRLLSNHPELDFEFSNQGISGQRISHLAERWRRDCLDHAPDVVNVLIGVNSTMSKFRDPEPAPDADIAHFVRIYQTMLDQLAEVVPGARLILGEPFLLPCGLGKPDLVDDVRERGIAVRELAESRNACFVPYQATFDQALRRAPAEHWAYDGVHPTAAGMWLMAETWLKHVVG